MKRLVAVFLLLLLSAADTHEPVKNYTPLTPMIGETLEISN